MIECYTEITIRFNTRLKMKEQGRNKVIEMEKNKGAK